MKDMEDYAILPMRAACGEIAALVVVTQRSVRLPASVLGKLVRGVALDRLWGLALG